MKIECGLLWRLRVTLFTETGTWAGHTGQVDKMNSVNECISYPAKIAMKEKQKGNKREMWSFFLSQIEDPCIYLKIKEKKAIRKREVGNLEIRNMYWKQKMHKNGGFNLRWFCFFDKLEERSFIRSDNSSLHVGLSREKKYV